MQNIIDELSFSVIKAKSSPEEISGDLLLLFVVSGNAKIKIGETVYRVQADDIAVVNQGISFKIESAANGALIAKAVFKARLLSHFLHEANPFFFCNSAAFQDTSYSTLKNTFYSLLYQSIYKKHSSEIYTKSLLLSLLDELWEHFRIDKSSKNYTENEDDEQLRFLIIAVNSSFQFDTSLRSFAKKLGTSASTLSRLFKKKTGVYFADYVSSVRAKNALNALLYTNAPLTQIALDSGFASSSVFNAVFRRIYGKSPSTMREEFWAKNRADSESAAEKEIADALLQTGLFLNDGENPSVMSVSVSETSAESRLKKCWGFCVNMGPLYALTLAEVRSHLVVLQEQLGFECVRVWNIFSKRLMIGTHPHFNFDKINQVLDFLTERHIRPFLDFGQRPDMARSADKTVFFQKECIEFETAEDWLDFIRAFMKNALLRYGEKAVSAWFFDVTYNSGGTKEEPYWKSEDYTFFDAWQKTRAIIKEACPNAQVGGFSGMPNEDAPFLFSFLQACKDEGCVPDFLSFILFPYESSSRERIQSADSELSQVDFIRTVREKCALSHIPLFVTEWNNSISNRNFLNDSCYRAAYIVHTVLSLYGKVDMIALLMGSDLVSSFEDSLGIINGGIGLLTKNAVKKPAYYAFEFLHALPYSLVYLGENCIVCKKQSGHYLILCSAYKWFSQRYFMQSEDAQKESNFDSFYENNLPLRVHIALTDLMAENGTKFKIKKRIVNKDSGSIVDEWKKLQFSQQLSVSDIAYISAMATPHLSLETAECKNGTVEFDIAMQPQEIALLECICNT